MANRPCRSARSARRHVRPRSQVVGHPSLAARTDSSSRPHSGPNPAEPTTPTSASLSPTVDAGGGGADTVRSSEAQLPISTAEVAGGTVTVEPLESRAPLLRRSPGPSDENSANTPEGPDRGAGEDLAASSEEATVQRAGRGRSGESTQMPSTGAVDRRLGERRPVGQRLDDATLWAMHDSRAPGRRRSIVVIASFALAAAATTALGMLLLGRGPFARPTRPASPRIVSEPGGNSPRTDTTASASDSTSGPGSGVSTVGGPTGAAADSVAEDTAGPMPSTPDLPRLPIGPTSVSPHGQAARRARVRSDTLVGPPNRSRNPAPVYTPGAAPVPRAVSASGPAVPRDTAPHAVLAARPSRTGSTATGVPHAASTGLTPAELTAIRTEIADRRRRVDSLRRVLDSLGKAKN